MGVDSVAGNEVVVPRRPEVRYFNPTDYAAAAGVVETLRRRGVTDARLKPMPACAHGRARWR